ncbi:MAG: chorismate mutase [Firmicutes bacterium]|nr:chorismate mutase [Bacillota bacterium]
MDNMEELRRLRGEIDELDKALVAAFLKRQALGESVARAKAKGNMALVDQAREERVLEAALEGVGGEYKDEVRSFVRNIITLSKIRQQKTALPRSGELLPASGAWKTENVRAAYQGIPGAWGEQSAYTVFPDAEKISCEYFENVFTSVKKGEADFGLVPIENSQTGAVGETYDLLRRHSCYIVGQIWIGIRQCLLGVPGADMNDVREVLSKPEGLDQCRGFLINQHWELTAARNTAVAARTVAERGDKRYAAIGSERAAELYGLGILARDITDDKNNKTRFIVIADRPIYGPNSNIISVNFTTAHRSGALSSVLERFALAGINLSRIESRPISGERYRFFADLQANILDENAVSALRQAAVNCDYFEVLGCYGNL